MPRMSLAQEVSEVGWYHTIALPGETLTPGFYDTPTAIERVPFPVSLAGKRCLDIATANGFWAFEMERRGASEVVAVDVPSVDKLDWPGLGPPPGADDARQMRRGFDLAHRALDSSVVREECSVYEITPERLGTFDFVFIGNVLLHLRDPVGALMASRGVVEGELLSVDVISLLAMIKSPRAPMATLSRRQEPWWWTPNRAGYRTYFRRAGLEILDEGGIFFFPFGRGYYKRPPLRTIAGSLPQIWFWTVLRRLGAPTSWIRARPLTPESAPDG